MQTCCKLKTAPEWFEGHKQEERGVKTYRPIFARAVRQIRSEVDDLLRDAEAIPNFNILPELLNLDWVTFENTLVIGWAPFLARIIRVSERTELRKVEVDELLRAAAHIGDAQALAAASATTIGSKKALQRVIQDAIDRNMTTPALARQVKGLIGLTDRGAAAVLKRQALLESRGATPRQVEILSGKMSRRLLRSRAESIARTEVNTSRNIGWLEAQLSQEFEHESKPFKQWVSRTGCVICETIVELGPIELSEAWRSPDGIFTSPPAHPMCRCSMELVFPD